jgi:hypothetical protein
MNNLVAKLETTDNNNYSYFIQKNDQNSLKGILWASGATLLTGSSLILTAGTVTLVSITALTSAGTLMNDWLRNSIGAVSVPLMVGVSAGAVAVDYLAIKFTGYCMANAIHHVGPEFQIVRLRNS